MTRQGYRVCLFSVVFSLALSLGCVASGSGRATVTSPASATAPPATRSPSLQADVRKDACLECHGPFDKLVERTAKYMAPSGETTSPHRFVPHRGKEPREFPACGNCHQAHPVPPAESDLAALPKPKVDWCHTKCHHTKEFTPCKACHPSRTRHE